MHKDLGSSTYCIWKKQQYFYKSLSVIFERVFVSPKETPLKDLRLALAQLRVSHQSHMGGSPISPHCSDLSLLLLLSWPAMDASGLFELAGKLSSDYIHAWGHMKSLKTVIKTSCVIHNPVLMWFLPSFAHLLPVCLWNDIGSADYILYTQ